VKVITVPEPSFPNIKFRRIVNVFDSPCIEFQNNTSAWIVTSSLKQPLAWPLFQGNGLILLRRNCFVLRDYFLILLRFYVLSVQTTSVSVLPRVFIQFLFPS
jgi:hypothetical protein